MNIRVVVIYEFKNFSLPSAQSAFYEENYRKNCSLLGWKKWCLNEVENSYVYNKISFTT